MTTAGEKIVLGSGKLFIAEFKGSIPDNKTIEVEKNLLGLIQGGATLEYKPSFYSAKDDLGLAEKEILTDEEATFKSGIMTWNGKTLEKLCSTARVTEEKEKKKRIVKIGGIGNYKSTDYILRFVHEDKQDGDIRTTIVGKNQAGFSLSFTKDKETVIDAEFKAKPHDKEGTRIIFEEDIPTE
ncbi:hypothetical protein [Clostridium septicum]|uniref:hypothetical protein n=1 Tax=Clostridium septicum TaxID=1504 RepID=UPI0008376FCD|nr:hypothetical protein [Clostridium septicum]